MRKRKKDREVPEAGETGLDASDLESHNAADADLAETAALDGTEFDSLITEGANEADAEAEGVDAEAKPKKRSWFSGWSRIFTGNKVLWITSAIAVVALALGTLLGTFVLSPNASSNRVPEAGLITVPVSFGSLSNDVVIRADVQFSDPVPLKFDATAAGGAAVVTGRVPEVGSVVARGDIILEIVDRPVIILPGELPAYRTLKYGMRGGDVVQLRQALIDWGFDAGDPGSDVYDQALADAVAAMYERIGYSAPTAGDEAEKAYQDAQRAVTDAEAQLNQAVATRDKAAAGPSNAQIVAAENMIEAAEEQWNIASQAGDQAGMNQANRQIEEAKAQYNDLWNTDTSGEQAMVDGAWEHVQQAYDQLETARQAVQPIMPASEVLYLTDLPRRVDSVDVERGSILGTNPALVVSGASVKLSGEVPEADATHLKVGSQGTFPVDGQDVTATVSALTPPATGQTRWKIELTPDELTPEQYEQVLGSNVAVTMKIESTDGDVLSVPAAALTAGAGGEYRVQVVDGDPRDGDRAETRLVVVETGLAAQGQVEVKPVEGELKEGDLVVVGR